MLLMVMNILVSSMLKLMPMWRMKEMKGTVNRMIMKSKMIIMNLVTIEITTTNLDLIIYYVSHGPCYTN